MVSSKKIVALKARVQKARAAYLKQIAMETAAHANPSICYGEVWRIEGGGVVAKSDRLYDKFMEAANALRDAVGSD